MDFGNAKRFLSEGDDFLLSTHVNADGDAIGSLLAVAEIVTLAGKSFRAVLHDRNVDPKYRFLPGFGRIESYRPSIHSAPAASVILVDAPSVSRIGNVAAMIADRARILNIDHHASNTRFGRVNLVDDGACATAEILYHLAGSLRIPIDGRMATQLYTGIMFDTGRFRYSTLGRAFPVAGAMIRLGAEPERIAEAVYGQKSFHSIKALGEALASLELHFDDRAALMHLPYRAIRSSPDLDGIVDYAISVVGVRVAALLKEQKPGQYRISLRSRGTLDVNGLAQSFGGGGHPNASGCCIDGDLESVAAVLLKAIRKALSRTEATRRRGKDGSPSKAHVRSERR
jgi:bifunctional oligoribonuclease and PAP phosphatase NrnA